MEQQLAKPGTFCPNEECQRYADVENALLVKNGRSKKGMQRYLCRSCGKTFTETIGTVFYRCSTPPQQILECLAYLAEGVRIASIHRTKGFKEDTILAWLRRAAKHAEQVEQIRLKEYKVTHSQIDALWAYVGHKGQKKVARK